MSNTLICLSDSLPFLTQNSPKERHAKTISNCETYSIADASQFNAKETRDVINPSQEINTCSNLNYNLENETEMKHKLGRKREATNMLKESVKRRDGLKSNDVSYSVVPSVQNFEWQCIYKPAFDDENRIKRTAIEFVPCNSDSSDNSNATDSGVDSLSNSSPTHSVNHIASISDPDEEHAELEMEIEMCQANAGCCLKDDKARSDCCSSPSSAPISEDLNCLHLTDEILPSNVQTPVQNIIKPPVIYSLFKNVSSTLYFYTNEEKVSPLPSRVVPMMKWKLSTITPVVIKDVITRCGFQLLEADTTEEWLGMWGKHQRCVVFKRIKSFQKVNHFPGSFHIGRKDKLWENYVKMVLRHGKEAFDFFPETFILPMDYKLFRKAWEKCLLTNCDRYWITKPPASARGTGIKVIHKWSQVPRMNPAVIQRYISEPYLINGNKFDLRFYVLVPSLEPLRIYLFDDGLVRFASEKYSLSEKTYSNRYMHLTNYSINRKSSNYATNEDGSSCQGHKWTLKSFWLYMAERGVDTAKIQARISDIIIKTFICCEGPMCRLMKTYAKSAYNCFELFGFDIMLDKNLRPWLLEVNISPSLHTRSLLDTSVKSRLVKDMLNIVGFQLPTKDTNVSDSSQVDYGISSPVMSKFKSQRNRNLSDTERQKHSFFTFHFAEEVKKKFASTLSSKNFDILENLTPDDIRCLIESEDEFNRKGSFNRIFPCVVSSKYFQYFDHIRYYNLLLNAWERNFHRNREKGILILQKLCEKNVHLQMERKDTI